MSRRWELLTREESEEWCARAAFAAAKLGPVDGVADMGCGLMTLERYLDPRTRYVPVDLIARDDRTIICDFNTSTLPTTGVPSVACLGLLSYLYRPDNFMTALARQYSRAFVTYKVTDVSALSPEQRSREVVTAFSAAEMEALFRNAGWRIEDAFWNVRPAQVMWLLAA